MTQETKSPWGNGDELAEQLAAEPKADAGKTEGVGELSPMEMMMRMMRGESDTSTLSTDEKLRLLRTAGGYYAEGAADRFKVGDLVTPTKNSDLRGAGEPHLVVEVRGGFSVDSGPHIAGLTDSPGKPTYGAVMDLRVLGMNRGGDVCAWWVEGWKFEPWTAPADQAA